MKTDWPGYRTGDITTCWHCGYAIQLRFHSWRYADGLPGSGLFWDHFVLNDFTCHVAVPKVSAREAWDAIADFGVANRNIDPTKEGEK